MYIDTSVAVKLFTAEPDSFECEKVIANQSLVSSRLLHCEFHSAILRKESLGLISGDQRLAIRSQFEARIASGQIYLVSLDDLVVQEAAELLTGSIPQVPLRTLDAIHLASFLSVEAGPLFTKDKRMRQAALRLGLPLADGAKLIG